MTEEKEENGSAKEFPGADDAQKTEKTQEENDKDRKEAASCLKGFSAAIKEMIAAARAMKEPIEALQDAAGGQAGDGKRKEDPGNNGDADNKNNENDSIGDLNNENDSVGDHNNENDSVGDHNNENDSVGDHNNENDNVGDHNNENDSVGDHNDENDNAGDHNNENDGVGDNSNNENDTDRDNRRDESVLAFESILKMAADAASGKEPSQEEVSDLVERILNLASDGNLFRKTAAGRFEHELFSIDVPEGWCFIEGTPSDGERSYSFFRGERVSDIMTKETFSIIFCECESQTDCFKKVSDEVYERKEKGAEIMWRTIDDILFREFTQKTGPEGGTDAAVKNDWIGSSGNCLIMIRSEKSSDDVRKMVRSMTFRKDRLRSLNSRILSAGVAGPRRRLKKQIKALRPPAIVSGTDCGIVTNRNKA